ncbi:MAG TPA: LacI family DNA-binding transcriptional regulator [Acidobacteriaceae bacterium]|nr:LacI family DNA-binding transcriptional regulator [Acidobacteriaceae bacterium]
MAAKAGVGTTTVSRVINGGERVSPETLARVLQVIDDLGYTPNQAARTLKGHRTKTIGLVIPSIADPFFASCAEAAQAVARANDSLLIVTTTQNDTKTEIESLDVLIRHRADGLLITPASSENVPLSDLLSRLLIPVVSIDRPIHDSSVVSVGADNYHGARIATEHLIAHGYKRILCLTGEASFYTISERIKGYRKTMEGAGLECILDTSVIDYASTEAAIRKALAHANPPDAIFSLKNSTTIYAFEALQKLNVAIPESIALLGFDDFELASTLRPSITVVEQPVGEIARIAAELLFSMLFDRKKSRRQAGSRHGKVVKLETHLIKRSSCGCVAEA